MVRKPVVFTMIVALAALLASCNTLGISPSPTLAPTVTPAPTEMPTNTPAPTQTPEPTPTEAPTATATRQSPTPLPTPTRAAANEEEGETTATRQPSGSVAPGISLSPQLGEPGDTISVRGDGFEPGEIVGLHWSSLEGSTGPLAQEVEADDDGSFTVEVLVPAANQWPGGSAQELDELQLRATSASLGEGNYYFANFKYLRSQGVSGPAVMFQNAVQGYQIRVPDGWEWAWTEDDTTNVRFQSSTGSGSGFVRAVSGDNVDAVIPVLMEEEFPGQTYETGLLGAGSYPGTQVTTGSGRTVQFIPSGGRTYVLSFVDDTGQPMWSVIGTFELTP